MPGTKVNLGVTFNNVAGSLPYLRDDQVLPATGALLLIDPMHSFNALTPIGTLPASGTLLTNVVEAQVRAVIGGSASLKPVLNYNYAPAGNDPTTGINNTVRGKLERSTKGGLHGIWTRDTASQNTGGGVTIDMPVGVRDWVDTYIDSHLFYVSLWTRITKLNTNGGQPHWDSQIGYANSITGNFSYAFGRDNAQIGAAIGASISDTGHTLNADRRRGLTFQGHAGHNATTDNKVGGLQNYLWACGSQGTENTYLAAKYSADSQIFHRFYMEDLTVSGRTGAQVDALDALAFANAHSSTGRYFADAAVTDPTTIA